MFLFCTFSALKISYFLFITFNVTRSAFFSTLSVVVVYFLHESSINWSPMVLAYCYIKSSDYVECTDVFMMMKMGL